VLQRRLGRLIGQYAFACAPPRTFQADDALECIFTGQAGGVPALVVEPG